MFGQPIKLVVSTYNLLCQGVNVIMGGRAVAGGTCKVEEMRQHAMGG